MKLELYCTCGAAWTMHVQGGGVTEEVMRREWNEAHTGLGHAPCDSRTASRARQAQERYEKRMTTAKASGAVMRARCRE